MKTYFLCMENELIKVEDKKSSVACTYQLQDKHPICLAADPFNQQRIYCGTVGHGLWLSEDTGLNWKQIAQELPSKTFTAVVVSPTKSNGNVGKVYAGTQPSTVYYSADAGSAWNEWSDIPSMPSSSEWAFPPKPHTHHVRSIVEEPNTGTIQVAIEAGAVLRSQDGGNTWLDTKEGHPIDAHTLKTHHKAFKRIYAACGADGMIISERAVLESFDQGESWIATGHGLDTKPYLYDLAISSNDPNTLIVSASENPTTAYNSSSACSSIYRKDGGYPWKEVTKGLPQSKGSLIASLAADPSQYDTFYALNNHGLFCSVDKGETWDQIKIDWKKEYLTQHPRALLVLSE
ncbi:WD40/YVTN/BNR-like repeat-containing protein [Bacillus horti]|uniref:Photosystem II stability/assembly factor-like uncharacterized protein n=1 Tax=Caldalkalibacillus horti TaxID=77523 RepID=A0ABT9VWN4_9BACI|nr:glycosyl hydrolase [Bacillus horti]MDQ0165289.1 photosystem II stability/assembly factor-like uncharacterized protein [Bacillus horti]